MHLAKAWAASATNGHFESRPNVARNRTDAPAYFATCFSIGFSSAMIFVDASTSR